MPGEDDERPACRKPVCEAASKKASFKKCGCVATPKKKEGAATTEKVTPMPKKDAVTKPVTPKKDAVTKEKKTVSPKPAALPKAKQAPPKQPKPAGTSLTEEFSGAFDSRTGFPTDLDDFQVV